MIKMTEIALPTAPEQLLHYFEAVARKSGDPRSRNGAEMCARWLALIDRFVTQAEIHQFLERLSAEPDPGTGWLDLELQFRAWARDKGFAA